MTRKEIRKNRWWKHILFHLPERKFGRDLREIHGYDPEKWREPFERFQSLGRNSLTESEMDGIHPLVCAQKGKEILITSIAVESMAFWSNGWGWITPILSFFEPPIHEGEKSLDRLTKVAILRMIRTMREDLIGFYTRHPGISEETRERYLAQYLSTTA